MKYCTPLFERVNSGKREKILATAVSEFATLGYRTANINVIAEKSGVSVGSLYKYFETKENLFLYVCSMSVEFLKSTLESIEKIEGGFFDRIEALLRIIQKHSRENPDVIHLYHEVTTQGNRELAAKLSYEVESVSAEQYARFIREAKASGEIASDVDERTAAFCLDNLFMSLQFSYSMEFYRERMKIYVSDDVFEQDEKIIQGSLNFIKKALEQR